MLQIIPNQITKHEDDNSSRSLHIFKFLGRFVSLIFFSNSQNINQHELSPIFTTSKRQSSNLGHPTRRPAFLPCCTAVVELRRLLWARGHTPTDHSCPPPPSTSWSSSSSSSSDTRASHHLSDHSDTLCWSPFMKPSQYRRLERVMFKPVYLVDSGCGFYCVD